MSIPYNEKYTIFCNAQQLFYRYIKNNTPKRVFSNLNMCCTSCEIKFLIELTNIIIEHNPISFSLNDLYITIIYIYYALVLNEQPEDYLDLSAIDYFTNNHKNVNTLIIEITCSDKKYAKIIRRKMFGFNDHL